MITMSLHALMMMLTPVMIVQVDRIIYQKMVLTMILTVFVMMVTQMMIMTVPKMM